MYQDTHLVFASVGSPFLFFTDGVINVVAERKVSESQFSFLPSTCARSSGGCWQTMTSEAAAELRAVELPPDPRGPEGWKP